jgi:predicted NBD/HSP70 family sugar kinase
LVLTVANSGSPRVLRVLNDRAALDALLRDGTLSRAELESRIGLSKPATADLLSRLEKAGLVTRVGQRDEGPGPRAQLWGVNPTIGYAVGVDVTIGGIDVAIADLRGGVIAEHTAPAADRDPIERLAAAIDAAVASAGLDRDRLTHVTVGIPGAVDPVTGHLRHATGFDAWLGIDLPAAASARLGVPVTIENDVNLVALNELAHGVAADARDVVLVWIAERGAGSSVIVNGELLRGATSGAGEIGFALIPDLAAGEGDPAYGRFGDLVSAASLRALAAREGIVADTALAAVQAARAGGDGDAFLTAFARRIAAMLAGVVSLLDPELIVLDGEICVAGGPELCAAVVRELAPLVEPQVAIVPGRDDVSSVRAGAVQAALTPARERHFAAGSARDVPQSGENPQAQPTH